MPERFASPADVMRRAIELARRREGFVEPNPMVGSVVVDDRLQLLGEGYHERFGGPHAEVGALAQAGEKARGATLFVTLEPCCHHGKTPPCTEAVIRAGIRKVVVGLSDPFPQVAGKGIAQLQAAGVDVEVGLLKEEVRRVNAPFLKLVKTGLPYVHAKWAMTLDGKIASRTGASKWISNEASRAVVHRLRGRMDAVVIGIGTALADDPLLTARPPGPRKPVRVVIDSQLWLPPTSQLVRTARESPVLLVCSPKAQEAEKRALAAAGVEIFVGSQDLHIPTPGRIDVKAVLRQLGETRRFTNILVEGGSKLLGTLFDEQLIDEAHVFVAPKLMGGATAKSPIAGVGLSECPAIPSLDNPTVEILNGDVYIHGPVRKDIRS